jgi:TetR/AcrR family transcriptional regulator of autoinduction and epiphytic fitness
MADPPDDEPVDDRATRHTGPADVTSIIPPVDRRAGTADSDGRTARRDRNRASVIRAMLDLIREGELNPATARIAERAGVSHRSVFRYFDDLGDLVREAINIEFATAVELAKIHAFGTGSLEERIDAIITARIVVYDYTFNASRVARFTSGKIEEIDRALSEVSPMMRVQLQEQFACELRARPRAEQDWTLDAILVLTDFTPYDIQRRTLGYDDERIADTWRYAMHALLT